MWVSMTLPAIIFLLKVYNGMLTPRLDFDPGPNIYLRCLVYHYGNRGGCFSFRAVR